MKNIFMTGGTGFLGGQLINNLVEKGHNIYILARSEEKANKTLHNVKEQFRNQLHFVYGDITNNGLGLSEEDFNKIHNKIDVFYHIAALVKFDEELRDELFAINYEGTKNTLEVADKINSKKFYYVSTAYTLGKQEKGYEQLYELNTPSNNPYEESKRKAEHLVFSYQDKMEVSIFRPAIIVGDSKTGKADSIFTLYGFIRGLEVFKKRITRRQGWETKQFQILGEEKGTSNFVPVDYVSNILTVALDNAEKNKIYHITNPNPPTNKEILESILNNIGFHNISIISPTEKNINFSKEEQALNSLIAAFDGYLTRTIQFYDKNTKELLNKVNQKTLNMDKAMLQTIISGYKN